MADRWLPAVVHPRVAQQERHGVGVAHSGADDLGHEHGVITPGHGVGDTALEPVRGRNDERRAGRGLGLNGPRPAMRAVTRP